MTPCEHPPQWTNILPEDGSMKDFIQCNNKRSQDLGEYYRLNGAIYIYDVQALLNSGAILYRDDTYAYKMSNKYSVDIDNEFDFELAEYIIKMRTK